MIKVYLDDTDDPRTRYEEPIVWAKTYEHAINLLSTQRVESIDLDYDLSWTDRGHTGLDVALWIEENVKTGKIPIPEIYCHSMLPEGRSKINDVILRIMDFAKTVNIKLTTRDVNTAIIAIEQRYGKQTPMGIQLHGMLDAMLEKRVDSVMVDGLLGKHIQSVVQVYNRLPTSSDGRHRYGEDRVKV